VIRREVILTVPILLLCWSALAGQELLFNFSQNRETYSWDDSLAWEPSLDGKRPLLVTNRSLATLVRGSVLLGDKDRWQEDYRSALEWRISQGGMLSIASVVANN
jgi:hypothetical protein